MNNTSCLTCSKDFYKKPSEKVRKEKSYCSKQCYYSSLKSGVLIDCTKCGKGIYRTKGSIERSLAKNFFCSSRCSVSFSNSKRIGKKHPLWRNSKYNYRQKAILHYGASCSNVRCPLTKAGVLLTEALYDVDHIDSNRENNSMENLQVLCVYCHAAKTRNVSMVF